MGYEIKSMRPIFKTAMLVYQSKASLDEKFLFGKITRHLEPEIRKCRKGACLGARIPHSILVHNFLTIEVKILFLTLMMKTLMPHKQWTRMQLGIFDSHTNH